MSKIEQYQKKKAIAKAITSSAMHATGRNPDTGLPDQTNDKHRARCEFIKRSDQHFNPMVLHVGLSYGYYGNSSGYSCTSVEMGGLLAQAITESMPNLLSRACEIAAGQAQQAAREAAEEARQVLSDLEATK